MSQGLVLAVDLVAIVVMATAVYFPRHRRRDMVFAYIGVNMGIAAVTIALESAAVGAGLGLGLFGLLSIVRLRSSELTQEEVAYYFVALAMGLLSGFELEPAWLSPGLMVLLVATVFAADHPRLLSGYRQQVITLDAAYTDERALRARLEELLMAEVKHLVVERVDMVRDTTVVDVRYRLRDGAAVPPAAAREPMGALR